MCFLVYMIVVPTYTKHEWLALKTAPPWRCVSKDP